jgi:putative membrane protein
MPNRATFACTLGVMALALAASAIAPADLFTWVLETAPVMIGIALLAATRARFPLTPLLYCLIAAHAVILCVGGHYTYAEVPIGFWARDAFGLARNHYDRLGHFFQGLEPAILAREILLRRSPLRPGKWLFFIVTSICLAFSACYELIEWWTAVASGDSAESFLGTQGDVWDPQWDMFLALCGALLAQIAFGRAHDRQLAQLG